MSWCRIEAAIFQDAKMIRAGFWGGQVFLAAITMAKLQRWDSGILPKADFDESLISHHLNAVTVSNVTELLRDGIAACVRVGLLLEQPDCYVIAAWNKHQIDPTNSARQARFRDKRKRNALCNEVTVTGRDVRDVTYNPPSPHVTAGGVTSSGTANGHGLCPADAAVLKLLVAKGTCEPRNHTFPNDLREVASTFKAAMKQGGSPDVTAALAFIDAATPAFVKDVLDMRRTFAMAENGRK